MSRSARKLLCILLLCMCLSACYSMRGSKGGGQTSFSSPRTLNVADVVVPEGYRIEPIATGFTFPTGIAFDDEGGIYVVESGYSYGEEWTTPRLLKVEPGDKRFRVVASGDGNGPWTGVTHSGGAFYVADGNVLEGGRILKITKDGQVSRLIEGLPSSGDHHANGPAIGPDGWIYFSVGTATNSAIVGEDNAKFGWLKRHPDFHDTPCEDVTLAGENYTTKNPLKPESTEVVTTGAFSPFGKPTQQGQIIRGQVPCNGAVMRISAQGGKPEVVAWGFRNPFGMAFAPDGSLFVTDNLYDDRGSRPIFGVGDLLWKVKPGQWYGWPDFHGNHRLDTGDWFAEPGAERPRLLLTRHPGTPPPPNAVLGVHASANGFDFSRSSAFGHVGEAFIAEFGDQAPETGKVLAPIGFRVVRVNIDTGVITDFAANKGSTNGPASWLNSGGLERPIAARFDPKGEALYVVDFGVMTMGKNAQPRKETGVLWRITRTR